MGPKSNRKNMHRSSNESDIDAEYNRRRTHGMVPERAILATPTRSGGLDIKVNGRAAMTIEPLGTPEEPPIGSEASGQHYIATSLEGPNKGQQTRLV